MAFHQVDSSDSRLGSSSTNSSECIPRRLDYHCGLGTNRHPTHATSATETTVARLDHQLPEVYSHTNAIDRTPRLLIGFYNDDSTASGEETSRSPKEHSTGTKESLQNSTTNPQFNDAYSGRYLCLDSGSSVHPTSSSDEEPNSSIFPGLGHASALVLGLHSRITMVEQEFTLVERQEYSPANSTKDYLRRCERQWLGMQLTTTSTTTADSIRTLVSRRGANVYQLEGTEGRLSRPTDFSSSPQYANIDSYRQHHVNELHQQTGWNEVFAFDGVSDDSLEVVPSTRSHNCLKSHCWGQQSSSRLRIQATLSEEQLDAPPINFLADSTTLRSKRRRPLRGSSHYTASKIRVLAARSGEPSPRRLHDSLDAVSESLSESPVESDQPMLTEDLSRAGSSSDDRHSLVALRPLVPADRISQSVTPADTSLLGDSTPNSQSHLAYDQQLLETRRLELIHAKFVDSSLNHNAKSILLKRYLEKNSTNTSYLRG